MFERVSDGGMLEKGIMELLYQLVNYSECSQHLTKYNLFHRAFVN